MFLCGAHPLSSNLLFGQVLAHRGLATLEFNMSGISGTAHFSPPTTQSQSSTATPMATPIQGETLSSDSNHPVTEDDLLGLLGSISWQLEDRDSINLLSDSGQNLAHYCAQLGYHRLLTAVIEIGADIHVKDVNGWTPLDFARLHRDEDTIDILEGDWEDHIEKIISTGSFSIDKLHRFVPGCVPSIQTNFFLLN